MDALGFDVRLLNNCELRMKMQELPLSNAIAFHLMNWGRIEYALYLIVLAIDERRAKEWTETFFATAVLQKRIENATKEIREAVAKSYPEFMDLLDAQLNMFSDIRKRRNPLVHGLWVRKSDREFDVLPLRFDGKAKALDDEIVVDAQYLRDLNKDATWLLNNLISLGTEMLAHQQLLEMDRRREMGNARARQQRALRRKAAVGK